MFQPDLWDAIQVFLPNNFLQILHKSNRSWSRIRDCDLNQAQTTVLRFVIDAFH